MTPEEADALIRDHLAARRAIQATSRALLPAIRAAGKGAYGTVTAFTHRLADGTDRPPETVKNRLYDRPRGPVIDDALRLLGFDVPDGDEHAEAEPAR